MKIDRIIIANLKCNGCSTTIKNELMKLPGVAAVDVDNDNDAVTVSYDNVELPVILSKLHSLGYPEATEKNGLLLQLKSYGSCMIGRINNMQQ